MGKPGPFQAHAICVVDDDPAILKSTQRLLHADGLPATTFSSPAAFLATAAASICLVVILDVYMPHMNCLEVQAQLRQFSPHTRVIVRSAHYETATGAEAFRNGAIGYLPKPCDSETLLALVRRGLTAADADASALT